MKDLKTRAMALMELRRRELRATLESSYDWFGDECECGLPLGHCTKHHRAREQQRPPGYHRSSGWRAVDQSRDIADWRIAVYQGGRGSGKTRAAAQWICDCAKNGSLKWAALVNETVKDVRDVMIEGPSGIIACSPPWFLPVYEPSKARVTWPNGAFATIYSAEQPNALRGPQFTHVWMDELPKWRFGQEETWDNVNFCLRTKTTPRPRVFVTTTPQPTKTYKAILADSRTVIAIGSTKDNEHQLDDDFLHYIYDRYANTRLGRQELEAELLEDVPGALWSTEIIDKCRVSEVPLGVQLVRVVVAVDPQAGSLDPTGDSETGIVVAAKGSNGHLYILEDCSLNGSPEQWARAALDAYAKHVADCIVVERNNGGDMAAHVIKSLSVGSGNLGMLANIKTVWASRGKIARAEPVAALYEQRKAHHVGCFPLLESQMCSYNPEMTKKSPDRLDALVWGATELILGSTGNSGEVVMGGSMKELW